MRGHFSGQSPQNRPVSSLPWQSLQQSHHPNQNAGSDPLTKPNHAADSVIYAVPRAEIVNALNRTLKKEQSPSRSCHLSYQRNHQRSNQQGEYTGYPPTIASLSDAAFLCERQRRYGEAERLYKQVLMLRQRRFGNKQLCVAESLVELAALYRFQQRYDEALPLLQQSLYIFQQQLGANHSKTQSACNDLMQTMIVARELDSV